MSKTYRLFVSHSWAYGDKYDKVIEMIESQGIEFYDHSVPINDPIHTNGTDKQLREAIDARMKGTSCILIMAGVYSSYSRWINEEIKIAKAYGKPIIAIEPWGSEKTSKVVKDSADEIVKWQASSVAKAIKYWG